MIEDALDRIARSLELPPEIVRERNFYREGDTTHYGMPVKDAGRIARIWNELKKPRASMPAEPPRRLSIVRRLIENAASRSRP